MKNWSVLRVAAPRETRMKKALTVFFLLIVFESLQALAQGFKTAQQLHQDLVITIQIEDNPDPFQHSRQDIMTAMQTQGYIMGLADAFNSDTNGEAFVPKGVTGNELTHVVWKYLDAHPEKWRYSAADEVKLAFDEAYHPKKARR